MSHNYRSQQKLANYEARLIELDGGAPATNFDTSLSGHVKQGIR